MRPYYQDAAVTIYNGRCEDVLPELLGMGAQLVVTDPPYNAGKDYGVASDTLPDAEYAARMGEIVSLCRMAAPNQAWVAPRYKAGLWWDLLPDAHEIVIPDRATNAIRQGWVSQFATVLAVGNPPRQSSDLWDGIRLKGTGYLFREETYGHPGYTPYPIMARAIELLSEPGGLVIDPFLGTGTAARAAKDLGRRCIGIEVNPAYCHVAASRMAQTVLPLVTA